MANGLQCDIRKQDTGILRMLQQMARLNSDLLSSIIGDIYDCSINPEGWTSALTRITEAVDAAYTTISLAGTADFHGRMAAHSAWDPEKLRILNDEYGVEGIPGLATVLHGDVDTPWATLTSMTEEVFQKSPFYVNWVQPQGLRDGCITKFAHTSDRIGLLGAITRANRDIISAEEQHFLALLSPHIRRAALIGDLLDQTRVKTNLYRTALDGLSTPVLLTDADSKILYANGRAQDLLLKKFAIYAADGILQTTNVIASSALADAILRTSDEDGALGRRGIGIPITAPGESPAIAYILPLTKGTERAVYRPASASVFISTVTSSAPPPEASLITLFDLTPAEARVMSRIGGGMPAPEAAASLGISDNTLKTHLGRIFTKTGVSRQADLMALMADIASPLAGSPPIGG
jgi:DNA-binding CsgD family transcriptional regulator/PAS domain-containing protein